MFDEAGGNWDAIEKVFGKEALEQCVSCEFHFFQCCNRQVHTDWSDKAKHRFKTLARSIFEAPTPYQYDQARKELIAFSEEKPENEVTSLAGSNGGIREGPTYLRHSNVAHHLHQTSI